MSSPAEKRRRLNLASSTLSKPFRSPLKIPLKATINVCSEVTEFITVPSKLSAPATIAQTPTAPTPTFQSSKTSNFQSPILTKKLDADPIVAELTKKQRALEKQLREVKELIDAAEQARKIERDVGDGGVDGELLVLTKRWRNASRNAAEEIYGGVKDRVNRMGGPRAWKEIQKKQEEFRAGFDAPGPVQDDENDDEDDGDGNNPDVEKRDLYAEYDIDPETENEKSQREPKHLSEEAGQEDEYTMAMMLRTLNIDLDSIGYDRQAQRWID